MCTAVAEQILPAFGGQELAIYVVAGNRLELAHQEGYPEEFLDRFEGTPMGARLPGVETLSTGAPIFFASVDELSGAYPGIPLDEMCAWAFLPLIASGHPVGSCILGFDEPHPFTSEERGVLTALGGLIAQALERARLYDTEFALARGLQNALLPHRLPEVPGVAIAARYLPGTQSMEIGGDWYDAIVTAQGLCLVIGDVEGHSVAAAATMGQLRSAVRAFATSGCEPNEVLVRTNRLLAELDPGLLASCCLIQLDRTAGRARIARAGHLPRCCGTPTVTPTCWSSRAAPCSASIRWRSTRSVNWCRRRDQCSPCTPTGWSRSRGSRSTRASTGCGSRSRTPTRARWRNSPTGCWPTPACRRTARTMWRCCSRRSTPKACPADHEQPYQ